MPATLRTVFLFASLALAGCTSAGFLAANLPAAFGPYQRTADVAYGPEARQKLDVYVPEGTALAPRTVVVFIHGGSWESGSKEQYRFVGSALAERGFISVVSNYRLNPGVRFPAFVEDSAQAVAWTLKNIGRFGGDPTRVYVMGHSAGAHIAMLLTLDRHYLAAAGVSADQLRGAIGLSGPYDFKIDSTLLASVFGSVPDPQLTQPAHFARGDAPPLLLIHGSNDRICRDRNSIQLQALIQKAGGSAELRLYPGLSHGDTIASFTKLRRGRAPILDDVAAFIGP